MADDPALALDAPSVPSFRPRLTRAMGGAPGGARLARMAASPQWGGRAFKNPEATGLVQPAKMASAMRDYLGSLKTQRPPGPLPMTADTAARLAAPSATALRTTWLGHSTVLLELDGVRLLTDPVFGPRASPLASMGPLRFHPPPVAIDELPPLDAIVLSHDHYDHLDHPTIEALLAAPRQAGLRFVTALGVGAHLEAFGVDPSRVTELDWWEETTVGRVRLVATPAQHFSGRGAGDRNVTLWTSFALLGPSARVFFSGDTGKSSVFQEIARRLGPFDLAMLEIGAFHPSWGDIHLGPVNALEVAEMLRPEWLLPVHWSTFALGAHPWDEPGEVLFERARSAGQKLLTPRLGEPIEPAQRPVTLPWWREVG